MFRRKHIYFVFSLVVVVLSSCITARKVNYMQEPGFHIPAYKDSLSYEDYRLRIGDRLYVRVYSTDDKTNALFNGSSGGGQQQMMGGSMQGGMMDLYTYLIDEDGSISFPMIDKVAMTGKTLREAVEALETAIKPLFTFSSVEMRIMNRNFSVIGDNRSGFYTMTREKMNIFEALAMAGDIGMYGDRSKLRILRETDNGVIIKQFDVRSADIVQSEFFYIEPNDVIYIQNVNEQFFSITNLPSLFSTVISTFSFGVLLYETGKQLVKTKPKTNN